MRINKITTGYVIQAFDTDTKECVEQLFVAGDQVDWESEDGQASTDAYEDYPYQPFNMVQPGGYTDLGFCFKCKRVFSISELIEVDQNESGDINYICDGCKEE